MYSLYLILSPHTYRVPKDVYDNGGDWLFGVHQVGPNKEFPTGNLIGFIHAEDHFYDPETGFPPGTHYAYKSIALGKYVPSNIDHRYHMLNIIFMFQ